MIRKYSLVIEGESGSYSGYVPELPAILVTGASIEELSSRAGEAIRLYWDQFSGEPAHGPVVREIEVELPA